MVWGKRGVVLGLLMGTAFAYSLFRRRDLVRLMDNFKRFSAPSAEVYDTFATPALSGFYQQIAEDLADTAPRGRVLEIGSGPGQLATKLGALAPEVYVVGIDIVPEMVERANTRAAKSGVADRVTFQVGDAAALPFPNATFDVVVSTLSLHHWANPDRGLAEIYRVLRPGGVARIYDVVDWVRQFEQGGPGIAELAQRSPFGDQGIFTLSIPIRLGPIPLVYRADLRHA